MFKLKDQDKLKLLVFTLVLHVRHRPIEIFIHCFIDFLKQKTNLEKKKRQKLSKKKKATFFLWTPL